MFKKKWFDGVFFPQNNWKFDAVVQKNLVSNEISLKKLDHIWDDLTYLS